MKALLLNGFTIPNIVEPDLTSSSSSELSDSFVSKKFAFFRQSFLECFFKPISSNALSFTLIPEPTPSSNQTSISRSIRVLIVSI